MMQLARLRKLERLECMIFFRRRIKVSQASKHIQTFTCVKPDTSGNIPALEYARASLARKLIIQRKARGWSQAELARKAGVRIETINRLEKAKHTADPVTVRKIEAAFEIHRRRTSNARKAG